VRLLAQLLYHGLTTGCGLQTLGEEYCNVLQVTGTLQVMRPTGRGQLLHVIRNFLRNSGRADLVLISGKILTAGQYGRARQQPCHYPQKLANLGFLALCS